MNPNAKSMPAGKKLDTPVLFLVFNRLDTSKKVFKAIREAKPSHLYIASDGARANKSGEKEIVQKVRDYIINSIDWKCEVMTLYREENLGCKYAVSSAIDWFFNNVEMGIILEDDCLPNQSFFWFCQELLNKYKNDLRVWHITGNNLNQTSNKDITSSYYFGSIYASIWGWATWRDRWKHYDVEMSNYTDFISKKRFLDVADGKEAVIVRNAELKRILNGLDTWDYQWTFTRWINNGLSINPITNMIKNIGFGDDASHTNIVDNRTKNIRVGDIKFPLKHPSYVLRDSISENNFYKSLPGLSRLDKLKIRIKFILRIPI